jgi:hypothetical protein
MILSADHKNPTTGTTTPRDQVLKPLKKPAFIFRKATKVSLSRICASNSNIRQEQVDSYEG